MAEPGSSSDYSPDVVRHYILHWHELAEMAQGTSNGMFARSTGGSGGRTTFAIIIADLEHAADCLPIYWQSTEFIFRRQRRRQVYATRRQLFQVPEEQRQYESPIPSQALDASVYRMALALGWGA
jgi:hypothetical protein